MDPKELRPVVTYNARSTTGGMMRGDGYVYRRKGTSIYWCKYHLHGKAIRESTGQADERKAMKFLRRRIHQVGAGIEGIKRFMGPRAERVTVGEILTSLERDYEIRRVLTPQVSSKLKPLRKALGNFRAMEVTDDLVKQYIAVRQRGAPDDRHPSLMSPIELSLRDFKKVSDATINRETQILGQAFKLRYEEIGISLRIPKLAEKNVRQGFFQRADFEAIIGHLPEDLQDFARFDYLTGWRKGEIGSLGWSEFNIETRELRLRGEESKNGEPRTVTLTGELWEIIQRRWKARRYKTREGAWRISPLVFYRERGRGVPSIGTPIKEFRKAWNEACAAAGLTGRHFHDFRRTAARNMRRAGVPEEVAMKITGHKTASMFRRYNITDDRDITEALEKTQQYIESLPREHNVVPFEEALESKS